MLLAISQNETVSALEKYSFKSLIFMDDLKLMSKLFLLLASLTPPLLVSIFAPSKSQSLLFMRTSLLSYLFKKLKFLSRLYIVTFFNFEKSLFEIVSALIMLNPLGTFSINHKPVLFITIRFSLEE